MLQSSIDLNISISQHHRNSSRIEAMPQAHVWRPTPAGQHGNVLKKWRKRAAAIADQLLAKPTQSESLDGEVEPTDDELCTRHMNYQPCRPCAREEAAIERAEGRKEQD